MTYPEKYINYLVHFHGDRDYFECHEELEELWKEDLKEHRKQYLVGLIQIAVALYHQRRGNFPGALRMMNNAVSIVQKEKENMTSLGFEWDKLVILLEQRLDEIKNKQPYTSINLPLQNPTLISLCKQRCKENGFVWGSNSELSNKNLIHKHSLRDRSEVITERERQMELKKRRDI
ncbi:DUF309 domain-containing protein [Litchfieldia alkalitelluris]|uniref:DUF309 domain-containing protein n=1 Tax=Litchfieldia alkalitelluris TaxID=304268 RepID=UPI000997459B|nr:DUF309 domain-containing protein [Litchfieldia alkalitelluris]